MDDTIVSIEPGGVTLKIRNPNPQIDIQKTPSSDHPARLSLNDARMTCEIPLSEADIKALADGMVRLSGEL